MSSEIFTMQEKRSLSTTAKSDHINKERPLKTTEEFDCERRGYKLTKNCLGTGAYAKVKLAYVTNAKLEKDKRLADELREKGTNKVSYSSFHLFIFSCMQRQNVPLVYRSRTGTPLKKIFGTEKVRRHFAPGCMQ